MYPSLFPSTPTTLTTPPGSPITCLDSKTVWTSQSGAWGCSGKDNTGAYAPAVGCTAVLGTDYVVASDDTTITPCAYVAEQCFVRTIKEFPDYPDAARTGAGCWSKTVERVVVYVDTRTGVGHVGETPDTHTSAPSLPTMSATEETSSSPSTSESLPLSTTVPLATLTSDGRRNGIGRSDKLALGVGTPSAVGAIVSVGYDIWRCWGSGRRRKGPSWGGRA
ncbi:hypothetical protein BU23DRAFT_63852 [Bimuria novae-zelandiae CBS 107.79]|uniref:Uncharacterized protein n=1 Tax=Bimuria novae-zelandiae CBS 107.79 TaxID=1447943 RepID=A0A6A5UHW7_9PLEO|nr:hypothetical protein BU23DRAFT_63852 [Bimuria novae-zelandiae CBS 107.79]